MGGSGVAWSEEDYAGTGQADRRSGDVPAIRHDFFDHPEPQERSQNINSPISGVGTARSIGLYTGERQRKRDKRQQAWYEPERALVHAQPGPEGKAASDLETCGNQVPGNRHDQPALAIMVMPTRIIPSATYLGRVMGSLKKIRDHTIVQM